MRQYLDSLRVIHGKSILMKTQHKQTHPVVYVVKTFIEKLLQHPEVYPIKYYKKGTRYRKNWKGV